MSQTLIITAYLPKFSSNFKAWIKKNINPSMVNVDGIEASYFLQAILDEKPALSAEDRALVIELQSLNVEYVEF